jgi:hypothetical protein
LCGDSQGGGQFGEVDGIYLGSLGEYRSTCPQYPAGE